MSRQNDLKMLFNFIIELLKDEVETVQTETKTEHIEDEKQLLTENTKKDESVEKILKVMKRVEDMDKFKKAGVKLVSEIERDLDDEDYIRDVNILKTHKAETEKINFIKDVLHDAKNIMDGLETNLPITPSVPPHELNNIEQNKNSEYSINQSKLGDTKNMAKIYTPHPDDK
jgi:hypothetical protein